MKVHMYEDVPNFGDVLNKHLWPKYFGPYIGRQDDILMFGIGTLLGSKIDHPGRVIVCGSGCGYGNKVDESVKKQCNIFFVRGPLSAQMLDMPEDMAITDPAILTPEIFPAAEKNGRVIFVPHWETSRNPLWKLACEKAGIEYVDPLSDLEQVLASISGAKLIIAEAMHAAIIGDAYGVPWIPVSTSSRINQFKWHDWASSLGMKPEFNFLKPLGASDKFRNMTGKDRTLSLTRITGATGDAAVKPTIKSRAVSVLRFLYINLVPRFIRARKDHFLLWTAGPAIDTLNLWTARIGLFDKAVNEAAKHLHDLSRQQGMQSAHGLSDAKRARLKDKFRDIENFLAAA